VDNPCGPGVDPVHNSHENTVADDAGSVVSTGPRGLPPPMLCDAEPGLEALARRRFAAAGIDLALLGCGGLLLGQAQLFLACFLLLLFLARDWAEGYSPGKRMFNLVALRSSGGRCTLAASFVRNVTLLSPLLLVELALLLFSRRGTRLGDILAGTTVQFRAQAPPAARQSEVSRTATDGGTCVCEPPTRDDQAPDASDGDGADSMVIDPGLLTPEKLSPDETAAARHAQNQPNAKPEQAQDPSVDLAAAARCIGIDGDVAPETLDDAYWTYVDRYSPDAARDLDEDELRLRCGELAARDAGPTMPVPERLSEGADRSTCLQYLNDWFVVINKCRDALA